MLILGSAEVATILPGIKLIYCLDCCLQVSLSQATTLGNFRVGKASTRFEDAQREAMMDGSMGFMQSTLDDWNYRSVILGVTVVQVEGMIASSMNETVPWRV